jgi:PAS domain S-box-containing protein
MNSDARNPFLISSNKQMNTELEKKSLEAFLSVSNDIVVLLQRDKIVFSNEAAVNFFKYPIDKLIGRSFCSYLSAKDELRFKRWIKTNDSSEMQVYLRITFHEQSLVSFKGTRLHFEGEEYVLLSIRKLDQYQAQLEHTNIWKNRYQLFTDLSNQLFFEWDIIEQKCVWGTPVDDFFNGKVEASDPLEQLYSIAHPDHEEVLMYAIRSAIYKDEKLDVEVLLESSDAHYKWYRIVGEHHYVEHRENKLIGVIVDIDKDKMNQSALKESQELFENMIQNINEVFFRTDKSGRLILLNNSVKKLLGYSNLEDLIGEPVQKIYFNPEDRHILLQKLDTIGEVDAYELALKTAKGEERFVNVSAHYYYDSKGVIAGTEGMFFDVTESRKIEHERAKILEEFRSTLSGANIHIYRYVKNEEGKFVISFSEGKYPIREGRSTKDVYGKTFEEIYQKQPEKEEQNAMNMAFAGKHVSFVAKWNGEYFQSDISPFREENGEVVEVIGVVYNINEIIEAERALVESEERYKALVENAQDGIVIVKDSRFVFVNQTTVELLGYESKKDLVGRPISDFISDDHTDYVVENHRSRMKGKSVSRIYETILIAKDAKKIPVEINNNLIQFEGGQAGLTFIRDLTQRKKDQSQIESVSRKNEALLEIFPLMYLVTDRTGLITHLNIPETVGLEYLSKFIKRGMNFKDIQINDKILEKIAYYHQKVFEVGQMQRFSLKLSLGGKSIHLELRVLRLSEEEALTTIDDITDRLEYQKRLIIAKEKAEESDRLKSSFLANMSHEIRTPMNAILGFTEMLSYPDISEDERYEFVDIIKRRSYDLLHIINDIIDVSKMEAGLMRFNMESISINSIIKDVISSFISNEKVREGKLQLVYDLGLKDGHDLIINDPVRLKQVFINLLNNAIKFTPEGNVQVRYKKDGDELLFEVEDTGVGIKKESQNIIFDRFMQAEMDKNRNYGGTGLGLTISKNIVEKLGGKIGFTSEYGKGSCFYFTIPYKASSQHTIIEREEVPTDILSGKKILIAEDEDTNYIVLSSILEKYKVECIRAMDGIEAIKAVQEMEDIDLILMDIRMPRLNGIEATIEITRISKIPVIMQTAYAFDKDINQALEAGAKDFVAKPISASKLITKMIKYLSQS